MGANGIMLSIENLTIAYGNIKAVDNISLEVNEGEIVTLIGANGAGKSSTLRAISGIVPYSGLIRYRHHDLRGVAAHRIVAMGMAQVPEGRGIFGNLTVMENLKLATWQRKDKGEIAKDYERAFGIFPQLEKRKDQQGGTLSGGEQQMLAVARALMSRSSMMLPTNPPWVSRPCSCVISSRCSAISTGRAPRSSLSNKTPTWLSPLRRAPTCSKREGSFFPAPARNSSATRASVKPTSVLMHNLSIPIVSS